MEENNTIKPKRIIYLKRKPKQYAQLLFNILMAAAVLFLFMQNIHIKQELKFIKANEFKLFGDINKQSAAIFDLQKNIISLDKINTEQYQEIKKLQKKK